MSSMSLLSLFFLTIPPLFPYLPLPSSPVFPLFPLLCPFLALSSMSDYSSRKQRIKTDNRWCAAEELKKQAWRFHKQYLTWFQRAASPTAVTDDYEQGPYTYFDWENVWCQRRKTDFRFEVSRHGVSRGVYETVLMR